MAATIVFMVAWALAFIEIGPAKTLLTKRARSKNYLGEEVPTAMGIVILFAVLGGLFFINCLGYATTPVVQEQGTWLALVCLAGLIDDLLGDKEDRGFRGHLCALYRGRLTTGMTKVFIIALAALLYSLPISWVSLLEGGVLVLSVNLFNQLDLRPGRCLKAFLILFGGFAMAGNITAAAGCGACLGLLPGDLQADFMLGDTGANLVGALAGLAILSALPCLWQSVALALLILGNVLGEIFSFNRFIEKSKILLWLDHLGRPQAGK